MFSLSFMSRISDESIEDLTLQLKNYLKLLRRPDLNPGVRAVLILQIEYLQELIKKRHKL